MVKWRRRSVIDKKYCKRQLIFLLPWTNRLFVDCDEARFKINRESRIAV